MVRVTSNDEIDKLLLEAHIYRMEDENKLDTLRRFLEENFKPVFVSKNEFHLDKLDQSQKRDLLNYLENI